MAVNILQPEAKPLYEDGWIIRDKTRDGIEGSILTGDHFNTKGWVYTIKLTLAVGHAVINEADVELVQKQPSI